MPAREFESFLQGARQGADYDARAQLGAQKMGLENLMSGNRIKEYKAENYEDLPEAQLHPAFKTFANGPGATPGTLSFNRAIIGDAQKAAEAAVARENRVSQAQQLVKGLMAGAPGGDLSKLPRAHQQIIATLSRTGGGPNADVDPKILESVNKILVPEIVMGKPLEQPVDKATGEPVGKAIPMPDIEASVSGGSGGVDYKPPSATIGSSGVSITRSPYGDQTLAVRRAVAADGFKPGTPAYDLEVERRMPSGTVNLGPDSEQWQRRDLGQPTGQPVAKRLPTASTAEVATAGAADQWVKQARAVADALEKLHEDQQTGGRVSMGARNFIQGLPIAGSYPWLDPTETKVIGSAKKLGIEWEKATGGMRMAASTGMLSRIQQIFRDPSNASAPDAIRQVADELEAELKSTAGKEAVGGRRQISAPTPGQGSTFGSGMKAGSPQTAGATGSSAPVQPNPSAIKTPGDWAREQAQKRGR